MRQPPPVPPSIGQLRRHVCWLWARCGRAACLHRAPLALTPLIIRWGEDASSDMLRRCARCSRCGGKGATLQLPGWADAQVGLAPFPVGT